MLYAAKHKEVFHMWWHPHNMGENTTEFLTESAMRSGAGRLSANIICPGRIKNTGCGFKFFRKFGLYLA